MASLKFDLNNDIDKFWNYAIALISQEQKNAKNWSKEAQEEAIGKILGYSQKVTRNLFIRGESRMALPKEKFEIFCKAFIGSKTIAIDTKEDFFVWQEKIMSEYIELDSNINGASSSRSNVSLLDLKDALATISRYYKISDRHKLYRPEFYTFSLFKDKVKTRINIEQLDETHYDSLVLKTIKFIINVKWEWFELSNGQVNKKIFELKVNDSTVRKIERPDTTFGGKIIKGSKNFAKVNFDDFTFYAFSENLILKKSFSNDKNIVEYASFPFSIFESWLDSKRSREKIIGGHKVIYDKKLKSITAQVVILKNPLNDNGSGLYNLERDNENAEIPEGIKAYFLNNETLYFHVDPFVDLEATLDFLGRSRPY